ncbi:N-(5-amino-5-carboxypentanoyl)-L-cysteinyl-D-val ine synthase [Micromonospora saelicesensis]|nr:N-(5-amino-5-carboxypentanoyl)-L-cysteinyl-D-val ine synthase [Micromonospora saelicesensis]
MPATRDGRPVTGGPLRFADEVLDRRHDDDAVAVVDLATDEQVSYRTLARRTQALTDLLAPLVGRHGTVAMVMDKSIDSVVCMLAALRLGARYVPVDESLPPARTAVLFARCRPTVTVAHPQHLGLVAEAAAGTLVVTDDSWDVRAEADYRPSAYGDRTPDDQAYVIFTSGSTGGPKGVMISHRSLCALLEGVQEVVGFPERMRYLNVAPLFFDASVVDLYSTFLVGGSVHLLPRLSMAGQVTQACEQWRITDVLLVPSVIRMLLGRFSDIDRRDLSSLRRLWFGGESCPTSLLRALDKKLPGLTYVHGYGPTETTHSATLYLTDDIASHDDEYLPIGTPLPAVDVLIVDDDLRPVPDGDTGELLIGGPQVMLGYCEEPTKTGQVLITRGSPETRYYRSGDFVRRAGDGQLVFVGRRDDAVKIAGNLVHTSEVEAAALAVDWVVDCCAVVTQHRVAGRAITLFVLGADRAGAETELGAVLARVLPPYMVPAEIVLIDEGDVGLTPTGKLDRGRLRELVASDDR